MIVPIYPIGEEADPLLVGGKASSLTRMIRLGMNVPPGIVIGIRAWELWKAGALSIDRIWRDARKALDEIVPDWPERTVSVRSGAPVSMPGMMDTILHAGEPKSGAARMRLAVSYAKAMGFDNIDKELDDLLVYNSCFFVSDLGRLDYLSGIDSWLEKFPVKGMSEYGEVEDVDKLMKACIEQVFRSWDSPRAIAYRQVKGIPDDLGTSVTIQLMVDASSGGSGVMLTRGDEGGPTIQWVEGLQGDAVVDGSATVMNIYHLRRRYPEVARELVESGKQLEQAYGDAMDIEFTFTGKELFFLQCRPMKRTPQEAMRIAVQLYDDHVIEKKELARVPRVPYDIVTTEVEGGTLVGQGSIINPRRITAPWSMEGGADRIFWSSAMSTDLVEAMSHSLATITRTGGTTCHAALVARELGLTCVVGAGFEIGLARGGRLMMGNALSDRDPVTILEDGRIYSGDVTVKETRTPTGWASRYDGLLDGTLKRKRRKPRKKVGAETPGPKDDADPEPDWGEEIPF